MNFQQEYEAFLHYHRARRAGERLRRLQDGLGHAEQAFVESVWWPMFNHFQHLHPEYEIQDYNDGYRYLDFAYVLPHFRVAVEIDGIGPHWRNITQWKFSEHCQRQNHLVIDGWHVLRFTYEDVKERPRLCQRTIQQLLGNVNPAADSPIATASSVERDIIRIATRSAHPITPQLIAQLLDLHVRRAQSLLRSLAVKEWLTPASGTKRIRSYRLHPSRRNVRLW
ncbi:hypothetical protein [Alicyclobacillus acidoterrestris]|uniref:Endonuclease domain-containing protein n=1 Tax=Alicyclobacillus acidoterrestris (strain ATCC 49025 / DSM 3922 / CIP 106132 / NCIMB 13137 / GD3B) TaxID=1356854 RepID=T0BTK1_ALIAG|nr:hypothetical protein [Alicyclobacillus acidoterrestris]EPZ44114.1 hypothetical protein N007_11365 [Alicyclobacillus acidoterrestris ATCC 49025]UNO49635.1 endonuclease domain-containing protein [Alicyclobacillus acidoterrestris]